MLAFMFYKSEINSVKYILVKSKKLKCNEDTQF